jgi:hypothetical protein
MEHLDSEEDVSAALAEPNITPKRRRLLRQSRRIQEGRESSRLYHQYRHRVKQTFDEIMSQEQRSPCPIARDSIEAAYTDRYNQPHETPQPLIDMTNRYRQPRCMILMRMLSEEQSSISTSQVHPASTESHTKYGDCSVPMLATMAAQYVHLLLYTGMDTSALAYIQNHPFAQEG